MDSSFKIQPCFTVGVCAMDKKSRSITMRNILDRLMSNDNDNLFDIIIFGDKVILDEPIENWPICDFLIGFYSSGFPLEKAISYVRLRKPFCVNDFPMQWLLLDRRFVLLVLDSIDIPTPRRLIVNRNDCPELPAYLSRKISRDFGIDFLERIQNMPNTAYLSDPNTLKIGIERLSKPFVEKPTSGEDHNIYIYYVSGGVRRLFRKVANKSSEYEPNITDIRSSGSFIYEEFLPADKCEDVKVYTVGPYFVYAETRKSPVVDGVVNRNSSGKELRQETLLTALEQEIARHICMAFGQTVCGFDMVRVNGHSYVIDVNGWSFVKGSTFYYDTCASILKNTFLKAASSRPLKCPSSLFFISQSIPVQTTLPTSNSWRLKTYISVIRHADRTPKQKLKFTLSSDLLFSSFSHFKNQNESDIQILIRSHSDLKLFCLVLNDTILNYSKDNSIPQVEDNCQLKNQDKLLLQLIALKKAIDSRMEQADTKVQLRRISNNNNTTDYSLLVVIKWGGEFTHSGRHHAQEFGESLRTDLKILNKSLLNDIRIFSSEERRVKATAIIVAKALYHLARLPSRLIINTPDLLDDNLEAKDNMDSVKSSIRHKMSHAIERKYFPPKDLFSQELADNPQLFISRLTELLFIHYQKFSQVHETLYTQKWCCLDSALLWRERWFKIFNDTLPSDKSENSNMLPLQRDPGRVCELWDSLKYDYIHNRSYLEFLFTGNASPSADLKNSLRELFTRTKTLYDFVSPSEYGMTPSEKIIIGKKIVRALLLRLIEDLKESKSMLNPPSVRLYVTKESHMYPLLNVIQYGGLSTWISNQTRHQLELDYLSQITFEIYERCQRSDCVDDNTNAEYSIRISLSQGVYNPCIFDIQLDEKHCLSVVSREWISEYIPLETAIETLINDLNS